MDARRSARNSPCASQSAGGGQRGNPRRGFPLCGRPKPPAASRTAIAPVVNERRAGVEPRPYGGWMNVVELAVDEGKGRRGRRPLRVPAGRAVCRGIYCEIITRSGRGWRNGVTPAVTVAAGRRGRRPLRGGRGSLRWRVCLARYLFTASQRGGVPSPPERRFTTHPILK